MMVLLKAKEIRFYSEKFGVVYGKISYQVFEFLKLVYQHEIVVFKFGNVSLVFAESSL